MIKKLARISVRATLVIILTGVILTSFVVPVVAAENHQGIAISGTFYRQHFRMLPGESLLTPDIYVVVFNRYEDEDIKVKLIPQAPSEVKLVFEESDFLIPAGGERKIKVGVDVGSQVVPGDYVLTITAEIQREGEGIVITGAAQQQAKLTVFGEAGEVHILTIMPDNKPFPAEIHLYQKEEGQLSPVGYSSTGELTIRLASGEYLIQAFFEDVEVAREEFTLRADEKKDVVLTAQTVFIQGFSVVANYSERKDEIVFANLVYSIKNIYQPLKNVKARLNVVFNGAQSEKIEILSLLTLDVGSMDDSYKYIPNQPWQEGTYDFQIELFSGDKLYAQSPEKELKVILPAGVNWLLISIAAGIVLIIAAVVIILRRKKKEGR